MSRLALPECHFKRQVEVVVDVVAQCDDVPVIESVLINRTEGDVMGAGETTVTVTAAAIGNAIFDATGVRLREIPFTPARLRSARAR